MTERNTRHGISSRLVWPFVEIAREYGCDALVARFEALLTQAPGQIDNSDVRIPLRVAGAWFAELAETLDLPSVGLIAAMRVTPEHTALAEYLAQTKDTLGAAMLSSIQYPRLLCDGLRRSIKIQGGVARLNIRFDDGLVMHDGVYEFALALQVTCARRVTQVADLSPLEAHFMHSRPHDLTLHHQVFGCRLRFDMPTTGLVMAAELMQLPLPRAEPGLSRILEQQAIRVRAAQPNSNILVSLIRDFLRADVGSEQTNATRVASRFGLSNRTLARKLDQENTSYRALRDETRRDLAVHDLTTTERPIRDIAKRLGFASSQSFHRAFKRWTGTTAMSFRIRQRHRRTNRTATS